MGLIESMKFVATKKVSVRHKELNVNRWFII